MATVLAAQGTTHPFRTNQDRQEFTTQALTHLDCLYTFAVYTGRDTREAEDLILETYRQAVRSFHGLQPATNRRVWLLSILRSLYRNRYQQTGHGSESVAWKQIRQVYQSMRERGENAAALLSQLADRDIATVLQGLPEKYRTAIVLVDIQKLSYEEATEVMACSVAALRVRLSRGRRMFQVAVQKYARERDQ
jgi:RNA polymerase sigma-70 factor (ECF subfamily)